MMNEQDKAAFDEALACMSGGFNVFTPRHIAEAFFKEGLAHRDKQAAQAEPVAYGEPIYQLKDLNGLWRDQNKERYDYNVANGWGKDARIVYDHPAPPPAPLPQESAVANPPAEVVRELVEALRGLLALDQDHQRGYDDQDVCAEVAEARAALAKAKEHGL